MAIITGTADNNRLKGTSGSDEIYGLEGNDILDGLGGDDFIQGGDGNDTIRGGAGNDWLVDFSGLGSVSGDDGNDTIHVQRFSENGTTSVAGGNGNDSIQVDIFGSSKVSVSGGAGSDTLTLQHVLGTLTIGLGGSRDKVRLDFNENYDNALFRYSALTITDFAEGPSGDVVEWATFLGIHLSNWDQSSNPFSSGHLRLVQSGANTLVQMDADGGGNGYQTLLNLLGTKRTQLTADNFDGYDPRGIQTAGRVIVGTADQNDLHGSMGDDRITLGATAGSAYGRGGSDTILGSEFADFLDGEVGHDQIEGRGGDDFIEGGTGNDELDGGTGNDIIEGQEGDDFLNGGDGNDSISGGFGRDTLLGGAGNDELSDWGGGSGRIEGGEGNDTIFLSATDLDGSFLVTGGNGNDEISVSASFDDASGRVGINAGAGSDRVLVSSLRGDIRIVLGDGTDFVSFGSLHADDDLATVFADFTAGPLGDRIDWGDSLGSLIGWNGSDPFRSGHLQLVQSGGSTNLVVDIDGNDFQFAPILFATFEGVLANELTTENLGGYSPIPVKNGTSKGNTLNGSSGAERLNGLGGNDQLFGDGGDDLLVGDIGNDLLDGGAGADRLYGGAHNDIYRVDNAGDRVFERAAEGTDRVDTLVSFILPDHVENLVLNGTAVINGTGNEAANSITGNTADNRLRGEGGNDVLDGASGADRMEGGKGDDIYLVDNSADLVIELAGQGSDTVRSLIGYRLPDHVEHLTLDGSGAIDGTGNALANVLTGNDAKNVLNGGAGADVMIGGNSNDVYFVDHLGDRVVEAAGGGTDIISSSVDFTLPTQVEKLYLTGTRTLEGRGNAASNVMTGNGASNTLKGNDGHDTINGGGGHDRIYGGTGNDVLIGGAGNDGFYFDTKLSSKNVDDILDFSAAKDTIYISAKMFKGLPRGELDPAAFHQGPAAADASDRILYDQASGRLFHDADGSGSAAAILFASVTPGTLLTHADFVVIG